jgi:hypothetical protein
VSQLLAFSRKQVLQPRIIAVNDVIRGVAPMLRRLIPAMIRIATALDADAGRVKADPPSPSTVHGIVRQSGGDVRVASEPGKGSVFTVVLPAAE